MEGNKDMGRPWQSPGKAGVAGSWPHAREGQGNTPEALTSTWFSREFSMQHVHAEV